MRLPTLFISHGGGPWPWMEERRRDFARTAEWLTNLPSTLPALPKAILSISGHWEEQDFTVATSPRPPMVYDYYNFPPHTYHVKYPAPGSPELAARVAALLGERGFTVRQDPERGFDHGTFVPLALMFPEANVPVVSLSLRSSFDPHEHLAMGTALQSLREEGVLIIGSGLSYHNLRMMFSDPRAGTVSRQFESWLTAVVSDPNVTSRARNLAAWREAPGGLLSHPREDHLIPLMVVAGAAGRDIGRRVLLDEVWGIAMASYQFG
jgi:aromatic ring-opening dioxygenase catalytic subunit (LigB family)